MNDHDRYRNAHAHPPGLVPVSQVPPAPPEIHSPLRASAPDGTTAPGAVHWACPRCGQYFPALCATRDPMVLMCRACADAKADAPPTPEGIDALADRIALAVYEPLMRWPRLANGQWMLSPWACATGLAYAAVRDGVRIALAPTQAQARTPSAAGAASAPEGNVTEQLNAMHALRSQVRDLKATIAHERQQHAEASEQHAAEYHRIATALGCHVHDDLAAKAAQSRGAAPSPTAEGLNARLLACGWERPVLYGDRFTLWDDGDPHGKVYLVCPGGTMVPFGSCEGDIDEQRVRFIMDACNEVLGPKAAQSGGAPALPRPEATAAPEGLDARLRDALTKSHLALADLGSRIQCTAGGFWQVRHPHSEMQAAIAAVDEAMPLYHAVTRASGEAAPSSAAAPAPSPEEAS